MGVALRYLGNELVLPDGDYEIGRDPECRLFLDDPIVSRRHAILHVDEGGATIEDLGSRNGVLVNRKRVEGSRRLGVGDAIVIGGQELLFVRVTAAGASPRAARAKPAGAFSPSTTIGQSVGSSGDLPEAFEKVARVARTALATGKVEEAERTLERTLYEILSLSRSRIDVGGTLVASAARHAANLAAATRKGAWVDFVFDLYTARREAIPIPILDVLSEMADGVVPDDPSTVTTYLGIVERLAQNNAQAARSHACVARLAQLYGIR